jgi:predicted metal-dependent hydrolase
MNASQPPHPSWRQALTIRRSARARHVRLKVHPAGEVELVVPQHFDERQLPAILDRHEDWVLRTLDRLDTAPRAPQPVVAPAHIHLPALDGRWQVTYLGDDEGRHGCREQRDGVLRVSGGTAWQPALKRWLARQGRRHLVPWLERVSAELELPYSGVSVRGQKSRWGSCSARRHINLNYALLFLPPECVRYLFVHELCHTVHLNHSSRYWQLVASKEPDYRHWERELRRAAGRVPAWLHALDIRPA